MNEWKVTSKDMPGLYQCANQASLIAQKVYFTNLMLYLILLVGAAYISFAFPKNILGSLLSAILFLVTLGILIFLRAKRPDDTWYHGRAVAESVKTRTWRWMMKSEPYSDCDNVEIVSKQFVSDLKTILDQNQSLSHSLQSTTAIKDAISSTMKTIRALPIADRLAIYLSQRVQNQIEWYWKKAGFNKRRASLWFRVSVVLHSIAIGMLLYRIYNPIILLPIEVIATASGAVLTWLQAKKHNELNSAYTLTAHEIMLIKAEADSVHDERQLSEYVKNSETAFSREHTQWVARKND